MGPKPASKSTSASAPQQRHITVARNFANALRLATPDLHAMLTMSAASTKTGKQANAAAKAALRGVSLP